MAGTEKLVGNHKINHKTWSLEYLRHRLFDIHLFYKNPLLKKLNFGWNEHFFFKYWFLSNN